MRRKLAKIGDRIRYRTLGRTNEGVVTELHSDYMKVKLDAPREPYYHELMLGYKVEDLAKDDVRRHGEYEITRFVEETR